MPNTLNGAGASASTAVFQEFWARRMQRMNYKVAVHPAITSMEAQPVLKQGDTYIKPYRSLILAQAYTRGTAVTIQNLTNTVENLQVTTAEVVPFYIDDLDQLQSNYNFINDYADDAAVVLSNFIDSDILSEYVNAKATIDDGTLGGVSGNGINPQTGNVQNIFAAARARLGRYNVTQNRGGKIGNKGLFCVASPDFIQVLVNYLAGKNSNLGDSTGMNGHIGNYYGFDIYEANTLTWTATVNISVTPSNGDTITFQTVTEDGNTQTITFTFVSSIGTTAGNVLINGSAANSNTNLTALINAPGTTTANGVALSTANQAGLFRMTATAAATNTAIIAKGSSFFVTSSTFTSTSNGFAAFLQEQHVLMGVKGATDLVIQKQPNVEIKEVPNQLGKNILPWTLYGWHTFTNNKPRLINVPIRTDLYTL